MDTLVLNNNCDAYSIQPLGCLEIDVLRGAVKSSFYIYK